MMDITSLSPGIVILILFGTAMLLMVAGLPVAFSFGGVTYILIWVLLGSNSLGIIASRLWGIAEMTAIVALPLFLFMGLMLEKSGIASSLYDMMHKWSGGLRGGLAAGTVFICMIMAAMTGLSMTAAVTMGLVALPQMLRFGYQKSISLGCILAGGALGPLIPPSVIMIFYSILSQQSVGMLFAGGLIPGVLLGVLFIVYIFIRAWLQPNVAPALPVEERVSWGEKWRSLRAVILPLVVIFMVLGSIFLGIATPTEASAVGAVGTMICAAINRALNFKTLIEVCTTTAVVCGMGLWIMTGTYSIQSITFSIGAQQYVEELFLSLPGGTWGVLISMQLIWFVMGCLLDPLGILMVTGPIFIPMADSLGFSLVWFGVVFVVNMEMAYITPPYGVNLFFLKGVVPKEITMEDLWKSVWPFVAVQAVVLALVIIFPQIILWLPSKMG